MTTVSILDVTPGDRIACPAPGPLGVTATVVDAMDGRKTGLGFIDPEKYRTIVFTYPGNWSQHRACYLRDAKVEWLGHGPTNRGS